MKSNPLYVSIIACLCCLLYACSNTPQEYFGQAVLNSNMLFGFASDIELRQLESPSATMEEGKVVAMKRSKVITDKIEYVEAALKKIKGLNETAETKEMLENSIALHEYVLPVYKNEYMQLAGLYDKGASKEQIETQVKAIYDKYYQQYITLSEKLLTSGKAYAAKNGIQVQEVNPSPSFKTAGQK
jgi:hypothetical protein